LKYPGITETRAQALYYRIKLFTSAKIRELLSFMARLKEV
jgi:hypothetical protein